MKPFNRISRVITGSLLILGATEAGALPTLYPEDMKQAIQVRNNTNSNIIMDSVNPRRVYVMPPNTATAQVQGLHTINANVGFCGEMASIQGHTKKLTERFNKLTEDELENQAEVEKHRKLVQAAREEASKFAVARDLGAVADLDGAIDVAELRLKDLYQQIDKCKKSCETAIQDAANLEKEKTQLRKKRRELAVQKAADVREYDKKRSLIEAREQNLAEAEAVYEKLRTKVAGVRAEMRDLYSSYGRLEGARAAFTYKSIWDENIQKLRDDNAAFEFEKIQTEEATIYPSIAGVSNFTPDSAILAFESPGATKDGNIVLSSFPTDYSSNIRLSLLGTCPMLHPELFDIKADSSVQNMKYGLTITYKFPSVFKLKAHVKYNMYKLYEKTVKSGSRGGLFSSRSWTSVEERNYFKDAFEVTWLEQDAGNALTQEEQFQFEGDMRQHVMTRLATLALSVVPDRQALLQAAAPPPRGAAVASETLVKTCPGNIYCMGAAAVFTVLDSIFGNSSSSASFRSITDNSSDELWTRDKTVMKNWITIYNPN